MRARVHLSLLAVTAALAGAAPAARAADPVIAAAGDVACGPAETGVFPCRQGATSDLLVAMNPAAVLGLGDLQYNAGALDDFRAFYDNSWGRLKAITHPVPGNHDGRSDAFSGYFDYFGAAAGPRPDGYYSFDVGTWHLIALNANCDNVSGGCDEGSPQERWLRADLQAHPAACTLAFAHQPLWASVTFAEPRLEPLFEDLYDAKAEVFLTAHDHIYERYAPSEPAQHIDRTNGVQQFIVGTGGRDLSGLAPPQSNVEVRNNTTFGVLRMTLHPASYDWQFVPASGSGFTDAGSRACHGPGAPPAPPATGPGGTGTPPGTLNPQAPAISPGEPDDALLAGVATRMTVSSSSRNGRRLVIRGRLTTGASARKLRLTLTGRRRSHRVHLVRRARGGRGGSWRVSLILPRSARRIRRFTLALRFLGEPSYQPAKRQLRIRPR